MKIQQVTPEIAESLGLKDANGAMVAGVTDGGPAEKAKIRGGDIILKFDGQDVKEMHNLPRIVADAEVGKEVPVVLWRDGKEVTVQTVLAERPADAELAAADTGGKPVGHHQADRYHRAGAEGRAGQPGTEGQVPAGRRSEGRGDHRRVARTPRRRSAA